MLAVPADYPRNARFSPAFYRHLNMGRFKLVFGIEVSRLVEARNCVGRPINTLVQDELRRAMVTFKESRLTGHGKSGVNIAMRLLSFALVLCLLWVWAHEAAAHTSSVLTDTPPASQDADHQPTGHQANNHAHSGERDEGHCPDRHDHESHCHLNIACDLPASGSAAKELSLPRSCTANHPDLDHCRQHVVVSAGADNGGLPTSSPVYLCTQSLLL